MRLKAAVWRDENCSFWILAVVKLLVDRPMTLTKTFDRVDDVSKIEGCNTRGIEYRWSIFSKVIATFPVGSNALDFGAGSLRESFDLAVRGFNVTSVDIDSGLMSAYKASYDWPANGTSHFIIGTGDLTEGLEKIAGQKFALVTCFDVLEHLDNPESLLRLLKPYISDDGKIFITVPNGRTLFELAFRFDLLLARATKRYIRPGEPHLQRNSPEKWKQIIVRAGYNILQHEIEIGFFANTVAAVVQLPLALSGRILRKLGVNVDALALSERICSGTRMAAIDRIDKKTKSIFRGLYGWNLFVASPVRNRAMKFH
jgi:2-polyprenyl-3-methyl-5-hydroxy-6-metoxy-1,4-benzoquinol methylase